MRNGSRGWGWHGRGIAAGAGVVIGCAVMSLGVSPAQAATAGAPSTQSMSFGPATGISCTAVGLSQAPEAPFSSVGLPLYAWNGVPLFGLIVDQGKVGNQGLLGPSCGDLTHGSSAVGIAGNARTSFMTGPNTAVGATTSVHLNAENPLMPLLGQSAFVYAQTNQVAFVTPQLAPGDQSFSISVTYTILSASTTGPPGGSANVMSRAGSGLSYASTAGSPSCNGQQVLANQTGTFLATGPGTYTAVSQFSCPPGQTLSESEPLEVVFNVVQSGWFQAGPQPATYTGSIVAQPDSLTVSTGS